LLGNSAKQRLEPHKLLLGEILQHMPGNQRLVARMADADAHPHIIVADMGSKRLQPIMSGNAAASLHPHLAPREVELVLDHDHIAKIELVEAHTLAHSAA